MPAVTYNVTAEKTLQSSRVLLFASFVALLFVSSGRPGSGPAGPMAMPRNANAQWPIECQCAMAQ